MLIRDRIKELRRVRASELRPHPSNWRKHPDAQQNALRGILAEVGYADALLARELSDGSLELIDGHLRAVTTPQQLVPVLILDVTEVEAAKILATHDPLAGMAEIDQRQFQDLYESVETESAALMQMLKDLAKEAESKKLSSVASAPDETDRLAERFQILIECADEEEQRTLLCQLNEEGYRCRALVT